MREIDEARASLCVSASGFSLWTCLRTRARADLGVRLRHGQVDDRVDRLVPSRSASEA